ncbi:short-chain dehydrogenase [Rathayibacter caricis DSM 15933]|uniref:Short-chain dehydrogenase n=1 Tax=Rathayibacter caricis DSM 15933 TaxID=1328867 RepID=A0A2T4UQW5_9MICO|nr:SDR family NAD(P)-dependent oxidoreductase [Rathayibacter caricis]PTL71926.1 short-chain dehydrogenase [Rathayibacter caricis DSM 15933]
MSRILVTGSTDGLGRATAESLLRNGHDVIVHARSSRRAESVADLVDQGAGLIIADLAVHDQVIAAAQQLEGGSPIDAVVHNAGVISGASVIPVNVVAPYLFAALLSRPVRHVFLSSSMHRSGSPGLGAVDWSGRTSSSSYSDSKLFVTALSCALAAQWPQVRSNAVDPGWVATKMGGAGAPDDFTLGHQTQEWLVTDPDTTVSGGYWFHRHQQAPHPSATDSGFQAELLRTLSAATGVHLPRR